MWWVMPLNLFQKVLVKQKQSAVAARVSFLQPFDE